MFLKNLQKIKSEVELTAVNLTMVNSTPPLPPNPALGKATGDILKAIHVLQQAQAQSETPDAPAPPSLIALRTGTSRAFVTKMLQSLHEQGFVEYARYKGVRLTPKGRESAIELLRHHRLLERFLTDILGFSFEEAHHEAERMEHVISEAFEARLDVFLNHPTTCPHGAPIPRPDGTLPEIEAQPPK